jgi:hypothetical protein
MSLHQDIWLTPVQTVYFLVTGDNLAEVAVRSDDVLIGSLARAPSASVALSAEAGSQERAEALDRLKEHLMVYREQRRFDANKFRDLIVKMGIVAAQGRRNLSSLYEIINPVEFSDLMLAGPHAINASGHIVYFNVVLSGSDLSKARQQLMAPGNIEYQAAASPNEPAVAPETDAHPPSAGLDDQSFPPETKTQRPSVGPDDQSNAFASGSSASIMTPSRDKRRSGPLKGSIDRYGEADRALYPELERIARKLHLSVTAAAVKLANGDIKDKVVLGNGTADSRGRRLATRYFADGAANLRKPPGTH